MSKTYYHVYGSDIWYLDGKKHREDGPAVITETSKEWWINGKKHRVDGPAVIMHNGSVLYYQNGLLHREGGPAIELSNGLKEWYINGNRHREDGPAYEFGIYKEWWVNNKLHRTNGPAQYSPYQQTWYFQGVKHRDNGPAVERETVSNDTKKEWWLFGNKYNEEEYYLEKINYKNNIENLLYNDLRVCRDISKYICNYIF